MHLIQALVILTFYSPISYSDCKQLICSDCEQLIFSQNDLLTCDKLELRRVRNFLPTMYGGLGLGTSANSSSISISSFPKLAPRMRLRRLLYITHTTTASSTTLPMIIHTIVIVVLWVPLNLFGLYGVGELGFSLKKCKPSLLLGY